MGLIETSTKVHYTKKLTIGILAASLLGFPSSANAKTDLLLEIDQTVISLHDYSVTSARIANSSSAEYIRKVSSTLNSQLSAIRKNVTTLDKDLVTNWTYLGKVPNYTYPDRDTMHTFDLQVLAWYNFELKLQEKITNCYKTPNTSKSCVLKLRAANRKAEGNLYAKITKTLTSIEAWRKAAKR